MDRVDTGAAIPLVVGLGVEIEALHLLRLVLIRKSLAGFRLGCSLGRGLFFRTEADYILA
jgi:hypothetical protein